MIAAARGKTNLLTHSKVILCVYSC